MVLLYFSALGMSSDDDTLMMRFRKLFWGRFLDLYTPLSEARGSSGFPDNPIELLNALEKLLAEALDARVMMSDNEDIDDACTASILFSLLPFLCGHVLYHLCEYQRDTRISQLERTRSFWDMYKKYCKHLGITSSSAGLDVRETLKHELVRTESLKSSVFKVQRAQDLDDVREDVLKTIEFFWLDCKKFIRFVDEELDILRVGPLLQSEQKQEPKKPWTFRVDKSNLKTILKRQVFRPDILMPSMSLDEFAKLELDRALGSQSTFSTPESHGSDDGDFYRMLNQQEIKAELSSRAWDDWKDDNPRGSGNKLSNLG